jgi:uncharacterized protein
MGHMEQRMDLMTLGVADVAAARHFYVDGLGWEVVFEVPGDIVFIQVNHGLLLALFGAEDLAADAMASKPAGSHTASGGDGLPAESVAASEWLSAGGSGGLPAESGAGGLPAGSGSGGLPAGRGGGANGGPSISLAQVVATEDDVRAACEEARVAGAIVLKEPQHADFGGFHCYFADPSGFRWEVATNPGWHVSPDGRVTLGPIPA